ncbi:hypothetical protein STEG23_009515, partial [Scotinomys teguina]
MEQNVLLCGGSYLFAGFEDRFKAELLQRLSPEAHVVVVAQPNRNLSVWIGGSILASLFAFQSRWIQREQYEEQEAMIMKAINTVIVLANTVEAATVNTTPNVICCRMQGSIIVANIADISQFGPVSITT